MVTITSSNNPLIKEIKTLYRKKGREKSKSFIIEGIKIIEEAVDNNYPLRHIIYTDSLMKSKDGEDFLEKISGLDGRIYVEERLFKEISDTENPQGILALASFKDRNIDEIKKGTGFFLFLDEVQDPGNMGTIIRSADAFKIDGIILGKGSVDPYNPKVVRSTMGSIFRIPLYPAKSSLELVKEMKDEGFKIITTSLEGGSLDKEGFGPKSMIIIGNEAKGVDGDLMDLATSSVKIPMPGQAESLNAGVAASIIMYEAMKSRGLEL